MSNTALLRIANNYNDITRNNIIGHEGLFPWGNRRELYYGKIVSITDEGKYKIYFDEGDSRTLSFEEAKLAIFNSEKKCFCI